MRGFTFRSVDRHSNVSHFDDAGIKQESPGVDLYLPIHRVGRAPSIGGASKVQSDDYDSGLREFVRISI